MATQAIPRGHRIMGMCGGFRLVVAIKTKRRDPVHQTKSQTVGRVRSPGGFMTVLAAIFSRIMPDGRLQEVPVTIGALIGLTRRYPGILSSRPCEGHRQEHNKFNQELLDHVLDIRIFWYIV
jgi:hypothetical protein